MNSGTIDNLLLQLPAVADLTFTATIKQRSERALAEGTGLVVDASEVQRIGSPCLQVLAAVAQTFSKAGGPAFLLSNPSESFVETVSTLGLGSALGLAKV